MQWLLLCLSLLCATGRLHSMDSSEEDSSEELDLENVVKLLKKPEGKLLSAIVNNDFKAVRRFKVGDVDTSVDCGWGAGSLLKVACEVRASSKIVRHILDLGARGVINQNNDILYRAVLQDNCVFIRELIRAGIDFNPEYHRRNRILHDVRSLKATLLLLRAGADPNVEDWNRRLPIENARNGNIVRALLKAGSFTNFLGLPQAMDLIEKIPINKILVLQKPILHRLDNKKVMALALRLGADHTLRDAGGLSAHEFILGVKHDIPLALKLRDNPFRSNRVMLVKKILDQHIKASPRVGEDTKYIAELIVAVLYEGDPFVSKADQKDLERLGVLPSKSKKIVRLHENRKMN